MTFNKKLAKETFAFILIVEALSFLGYLYPYINKTSFFLLAALTLALSIYRLEYGLWLVLGELFIGSKGYLFDLQLGNFNLSIRIALWLIVMTVWFIKELLPFLRTQQKFTYLKEAFQKLTEKENRYFTLLGVFIVLAAIIGYTNQNQPAFVFDEFKRWLYLLLIFPIFKTIKDKKSIENIAAIFLSATVWLAIKSLLLLFVFSHGIFILVFELYRWVRNTGVGEITQIEGGFYRVFIQSQIYNLFSFFIAGAYLLEKIVGQDLKKIIKSKTNLWLFGYLSISLTIILLSFSRSFWVGTAAGLIVLFALLIQKTFSQYKEYKTVLKKILSWSLFMATGFFISLAIIIAIVKFPYPNPLGGFAAGNLFSERATEMNESAIGSRWSLLPKLWQKIQASPILGQGLGTTVTYQSFDPRVLKLNPKGEYTTYAFEWGWLDIWLKLGIFGLLSYLILLVTIVYDAYKSDHILKIGIACSLIVLAAVNFFTPYLNHPLGLGFLILAATAIKWRE